MKTIIGYGSLMNKDSANLTCETHGFQYGYIQGYSRIFNKLGYNPHIKKFNEGTSMLNIQKDDGVWMIISYFQISDSDYIKIKQREWDYNEEIVNIYDLDKNFIQTGIIFISKKSIEYKGKNIQLLHSDIQPEERYMNICLSAIKQTPYLKNFLETTYQSCGQKKIKLDK